VSWHFYRHRFGFLMGAAALILFPYAVASTYVQTHFLTADVTEQVSSDIKAYETSGSTSALSNLPHGAITWYCVLFLVYLLIVFPLFFGTVTHMTSHKLVLKKDLALPDAGNHAFRRWLPNASSLLLAFVVYAVLAIAYTILLALVTSALSSISTVFAFIVGAIGTLAFIVGVIGYFIRMAFIPSIVLEEKRSLFRAMRQSFRLTRRETRRLVGFFIMLLIVCFVVQTFMTVIGDVFLPGAGAQLLASIIVSMLITPFAYVSISVMYLDLRTRKWD
jgi:hypothetical protein